MLINENKISERTNVVMVKSITNAKNKLVPKRNSKHLVTKSAVTNATTCFQKRREMIF